MLVIRVLGELELERDGERLDPPGRQSGRLLLGYLALAPGLHARSDLAALLWPDILESSARVSLRSAIASVRRTLGDDSERYLLSSGNALGLADATQGVVVDAQQFDALIAEGKIETALDLARGPLLQGLDAEWLRQARADHVERVSDLLGQLAREAEEAGAMDQAIRYTRRQVALAPMAEPPNRDLMRRLVSAGDRASALTVYADLAERFRREFQTLPSLPTRQLADEARRAGRAQQPPTIPLPPALAGLLSAPFVNREAELVALGEALERAQTGSRQTALVSGEPGIGKSALLARFAEQAGRSSTVVSGRCQRPSSGPLEPLVEALTHYVTNVPPEELRLPPEASELTALVPAINAQVRATPPPADLLQDGGRVARAMVETIESLAADVTLVLVLEDLHNADRATLELVGSLLGAPGPARLMVVVTFRETELARSPLLKRLGARIRALPTSTEISLQGLDEDAIAELARRVSSRELVPDDATHLRARTNGNPFLVGHLLAREDPLAALPLPQRIQDFVWQEVSLLGSDAQTCLSIAAVAGEDFDLGTVASVAGFDDDRALDALDEAVFAKVAVELPDSVGRYRFRHDLLRSGIYESLTSTRRAHVHRRLADVLISRHADRAEQRPGMIVEHLRAGGDLVPRSELLQWLTQAAEDAENRRTYAEAAEYYAEAVELSDGEAADPRRRAEVLISLARAARRAGQTDRAVMALHEAHVVGRQAGDDDLELAAALDLCSIPFVAGDRPPDDQTIAMLKQALELVPAKAPGARARLQARLALDEYYEAGVPRPDELAAKAVALARESREPAALAAALDVGHLAFRGPNGPEERARLAGELRAAARENGDEELLVAALVHQTVDQVELGELDALPNNAASLDQLAERLQQPAYAWWAELWRATAAIATGQLEEGGGLAKRAFDIAHVSFGEAAQLELRAQLAWIALELQRFEQLSSALPALEGGFPALPVWQALRARVLVETGAEEAAMQSAAELMRRGLGSLERDTNWLISAALLAETAAKARDVEIASQLEAVLAPRAEHWAVSARGTVCLGPVAGSLALLSATRGKRRQADTYHRAARQSCESVGASTIASRLERLYREARSATSQSRRGHGLGVGH